MMWEMWGFIYRLQKFHPKVRNHGKGPFSWLKAATTAFTFKTLLRHYAKQALTPRSLNMKLGPQRKSQKGRAAIRHYANQTAQFRVERPWGQRPFSIVS